MFKKVMIAVAAAGLLSACADRWDVEGAASMPNQGDAFAAALQSGYVDRAEHERNYGDWGDTAYFVAKAKAAAMGEMVGPTEMAERDLPAKYVDELTAARGELVSVLDAGARSGDPANAAKAQTAFDCWMEEAEEDRQPDHIEECKQEFEIAMNALRVPAAPFVVYFALDSARLDAEAMGVINEVAEAFANQVPARVLVVGHTDTSGSAQYNILLSQRRAEAVAQALAARGIASEVMTLEAYGEERLAVPTPDSTVERLNRRVEIYFRG